MKILLTHATGNQNVRNAARAFLDAGILAEFWTCIGRGKTSPLDRLLPGRLRSELRRRALDGDLLRLTHKNAFRECVRLAANRFGPKALIRHESGWFSTDAIMRDLDQRVARRLRLAPVDAVYAHEDGALACFRTARDLEVRRIYELPIGYWRLGHQIFAEEAERWPEWANTLEGLRDSPAKLDRKDEEASLADLIVVPSPFVAESLALCPSVSAPKAVVNYGCPPAGPEPPSRAGGRLRVLFVGSLGARKGLPYLLEAVKGLDLDLTLIGSTPTASCPPLEQALSQYRYLGSVPRERVLHEMRCHDIFLFPTLFEGLALSLLEALAQGLVPITTLNSGGGGIIRHGENGYLVPIRDSAAIRERLIELDRDRDRLRELRYAARTTAIERQWGAYREALVRVVCMPKEADQ